MNALWAKGAAGLAGRPAAVWGERNGAVYGFLAGGTLSQLVDKQRTKPVSLVRGAHSRQPPPLSS